MRRFLASLGGYLLLSAALSAAPCAPSPTTLCLNDSRFEVEVSWRDSRARTGVGQAKTITADTGYFWFFSESNIELVIKVLDARSINQKYWVFFGALTSVEFDLTVTDTLTGAVKTYHNALGTFASVGDTGAFDPSVTAPSHEIVSSEGTSTPPESLASIQKFIEAQASEAGAAFTPCAENGAALYLANCRFRLEVHWSDSRGRHGAGRPVQLTNDTGYFWFFSDSNVELMVKVLDARGINDKFWVFFGALSSVEYTINVFDTVSGSLRSYHNPQGAFASVGDTSAFRGGYSISIQTDDARAVSAPVFAATGGSLSATAANGTVFTLVIPPNSLYDDETVMMTPVSSAGQLPFAGGLVGGVDIQPAGVPLLEGATLSIHTPAPIARSEETPVAWNGSGEDFFLFPPWPTSGDLKLEISHFGGYGVARGTDGERQAQLGQGPVADSDLLSHEISPLTREARAGAALNDGSELKRTLDLIGRLASEYQGLEVAMLNNAHGNPAVILDLIQQTIDWMRMVRVATGKAVDTVFPGRSAEIRAHWTNMIVYALAIVREQCSEDPTGLWEIMPITRIISWSGLYSDHPELRAEVESVLKCLTFKLRFESTITITFAGWTITYPVLAESVILRAYLPDDFDRRFLSGEGTISHLRSTWLGLGHGCEVTWSGTPSTFLARLVLRNTNPQVGLVYSPGTPSSSLTGSCGAEPITLPGTNEWVRLYKTFRVGAGEIGNSAYYGLEYLRVGWSITGRRDPWALRTVGNNDGSTAEITVFTLTHTPE